MSNTAFTFSQVRSDGARPGAWPGPVNVSGAWPGPVNVSGAWPGPVNVSGAWPGSLSG